MFSRTGSGVTVPSARAYELSVFTTVLHQCAYGVSGGPAVAGMRLMASGFPLDHCT
jgi:hypothetical protein